jgi:formate dehydrogenase iron-sulfur subunit
VGGTHVMYVLQHAEQPQLYAGLPNNPRISPLVEAWKGVGKYAGLAVIGLTAAAGLLHHLLQGPNRVSKEDEDNADRLAGGGRT